MALSERFKKQAEAISTRRAELAFERSRAISQDIIKSDQFQLALDAGVENMEAAIDIVLKKACETIFDPVADFLDTLRAKGMPESYIRQYVHRLYVFIYGTDKEKDKTYEDMLSDVAVYMVEHPEMYMSIQDSTGEELITGMDASK